ncbi:response regulator [Longimicrobium terrae]|uniref:Diguanylate cyclase (GGDEF)-like protein n=1 Tax=Longimicrobium terrae TaxID=1639882 RepID=A0A841GQE5_9BACT|nr:response regulator [Longimicrobium terrae]MBB4634865.1 diguanylate cyclase (GGDEF)-like protein [Longimicrobium terrae]MBB6069260.1 diguanylate cyclase (GGDEF)-like protein [Longimicrobium terrae]NNC31931.1 response regulator [Longimicrobium terrae]
MTYLLAAGLPPDVPGWLARRLSGASVQTAATSAETAEALAHDRPTLLAVDAALLDDLLVTTLTRGPEPPPLLVLLPPGAPPAPLAEALSRLRPARILYHPLDREALAREAAALLGVAAAPPTTSGSPRGSLGAAVAGVWQRFREPVLRRVDSLEEAAMGLLEGRLDAETRRAAEREAHKLAGSVGTFGFGEASRLSREAETLLAGPGVLGQADALRLADLAVSIRRELMAEPATPGGMEDPRAGASPEEARGPLLLIVDEDREMAERLAMEASGRGMRTLVAHGAAEAQACLPRRPDAAVLGLPPSDGTLNLLRALSEQEPSVPTIVLTGSDDFADRVEVARHGGRGFLRKPQPPARVVDAVEPLLRRARERETVLAVDDDPSILEGVRHVLSPEAEVRTLQDPLGFWEALESASPDLVLLDVDMPAVSGLELCRVLRNDPRWQSVPIVFLTSRTDADTVARVFAAGADDFVAKPFVGPELAARIRNRLERVRLQRSMAETDPLTGVANRRGSEEVLERLLRLAAAQDEPFALGVVDLDLFKAVNDQRGHAAGDEVLARVGRLLQKRFRSEDVVARWGGEEFVVGMYGMDRADGVQRLAEALEVLREERFHAGGESFSITMSGGVADFPSDGRDLPTLYRAADAAMYQAKSAGRDRIVPSGWRPEHGEGPRAVDVLVVEDDPAIARLLQHALETRGYRHEWVASGERAAAMLTGDNPELRARAVLLDVDLPGLDGHGVLRRLAEARLLDRTRVIMLTVRTHEAEVVRALELGAWDHVSKPFSVPVLLQRIRRALRA